MLSRRRSARRDDGVVMVMVALLLVSLFGISALVLDLGYARQESRHVQASADAGALAGSRELPLHEENAPLAAEARRQAARNINRNLAGSDAVPTSTACDGSEPPHAACYFAGTAFITVATPYTVAGADAPEPYNLIYVKICQPTPTFFAGVMGQSSPTVCRESVARRQNVRGPHNWGLVVLDPIACSALSFDGSSSTTLSSTGAVMVNSNCVPPAGAALNSNGRSWNLATSYVGVVGDSNFYPCDTCSSTVPEEGIEHFNSPISLSPPSPLPGVTATPCPATPPGYSGTGERLLQPGRYSNRCVFNGDRQYVFGPGVYYFDNGFVSSGSASLTCRNSATDTGCDGVTFIIGNNSVDLTGNGRVSLPPPQTGDYAGVSIYQMSGTASKIDGSNDFALGTVYAPTAHFNFTGSGGSERVNIRGMVVAKTIGIAGDFQFNIVVPTNGDFNMPLDDIGLET